MHRRLLQHQSHRLALLLLLLPPQLAASPSLMKAIREKNIRLGLSLISNGANKRVKSGSKSKNEPKECCSKHPFSTLLQKYGIGTRKKASLGFLFSLYLWKLHTGGFFQ
ncbi:unnamed protein product [Lactuca virosa]|uniref:Secreted protein n=1 Tax=Lactuca virosa TaxID=75947 RepID=A0AAU9LVX6_9ASTR|nr:unnamed protein product [Lactuca virosa]